MHDFTRLELNGPLQHHLLGSDIEPICSRTLDLLLSHKFRGIDPGSYYSKNLRRFRATGSGLAPRAWNRTLNQFVALGGSRAVQLFNLPEITSTKAAALTLAGLSGLRGDSRLCDQKQLYRLAEELINWLLARRNDQIGAWTPDFVYEIKGQSISRSVLGTINTVFCADALWQWRNSFPYVDKAIVAAGYACHELLPRVEDEKHCCFSYSPSVDYYVHNANLFVALLIARCRVLTTHEIGSAKLVEKCIRYTLDDFDDSGSLRYAGPPTVNNTVDNYHTGFVIRTLADVSRHVQSPDLRRRIENKIESALVEYRTSFVKVNGIVKFKSDKRRIQAHSVAEALLLYSRFKSIRPELFDRFFKKSVRKSLDGLWNARRNQYDSEIRSIGSVPVWRNEAPMPRWSWAWLFKSLVKSAE